VNRRSRWVPLAFCVLSTIPVDAHATATIVIQNANDPGVGFNDPTAAQPVGGNPGTTIGQQRLIAFKYAAFVWGMAINSNPTILISAKFEPLTCDATTAFHYPMPGIPRRSATASPTLTSNLGSRRSTPTSTPTSVEPTASMEIAGITDWTATFSRLSWTSSPSRFMNSRTAWVSSPPPMDPTERFSTIEAASSTTTCSITPLILTGIK